MRWVRRHKIRVSDKQKHMECGVQEVDEQLSKAIQRYQGLAPQVNVTEMQLDNLSVEDCNNVLMDLLSMHQSAPGCGTN